MNEPTRWRDDPARAPAGVLRLLDEVRPVPPLPGEVRSRVARRLGRAASLAAAPALWWVALKSAAAAGSVGILSIAAITTVVTQWQGPGATASGPASGRAVTPPRGVSASSAPPHAAPALSAAPSALADPRPPVAAFADAPATEDSLAAETLLVERSRRVLTQDPGLALDLAREHGRQYPAGQLGAERLLVEIEALFRLGRLEEARALAQRALTRHPDGLYAERIRRLLEQSNAAPPRP